MGRSLHARPVRPFRLSQDLQGPLDPHDKRSVRTSRPSRSLGPSKPYLTLLPALSRDGLSFPGTGLPRLSLTGQDGIDCHCMGMIGISLSGRRLPGLGFSCHYQGEMGAIMAGTGLPILGWGMSGLSLLEMGEELSLPGCGLSGLGGWLLLLGWVVGCHCPGW